MCVSGQDACKGGGLTRTYRLTYTDLMVMANDSSILPGGR